jgi:hypothetical protein
MPGLAHDTGVLEDELALKTIEIGSENLGHAIDDRVGPRHAQRFALRMAIEHLRDLVFRVDRRRARRGFQRDEIILARAIGEPFRMPVRRIGANAIGHFLLDGVDSESRDEFSGDEVAIAFPSLAVCKLGRGIRLAHGKRLWPLPHQSQSPCFRTSQSGRVLP